MPNKPKKKRAKTNPATPKPAPIGRKIKARAVRLRKLPKGGLVLDVYR